MNRIAKFEKISFECFNKSIDKSFLDGQQNILIEKIYDDILLPARATSGSAGYDFYAPFDFSLKSGSSIIIPTGIRVLINDGWVLQIFPRSGLGFKYRIQLDNTVGIIDSDYYYSDNEGHIFIKITNDSKNKDDVVIKKGTAFAQGIFIQYGITFDDNVDKKRNGGLGSTSR